MLALNMLRDERHESADFLLGKGRDVLSISTVGNGHVARNIRLALLALELVEPYVVVRKVQGLNLSEDLVPLEEDRSISCRTTRAVEVPREKSVTIEWTVGGLLRVDETALLFAVWDSKLEAVLDGTVDCEAQPDWTILEPLLSPETPESVTSGHTEFGGGSQSGERIPATTFAAAASGRTAIPCRECTDQSPLAFPQAGW